jgi:hypothetical protein
MKKLAKKYLILVPVLMAGCASSPKAEQPLAHAESAASRPQPQSEAAHNSECLKLNYERHRQQEGLSLAATMEPGSQKRKDILLVVRNNLDAIQAREQKIGCITPPVVTPKLTPPPQ